MKSLQLPLGCGLALALVMGSSQNGAADITTCKRALNKAHINFLVSVAKAKAKAAKGRRPGKKFVPPSVTAARIASAREKARLIINAGCAGVGTPQDADPNLCPGIPDFDACLTDYKARAEATVDDLHAQLLPQRPICIDDPPPICGSNGLPTCETENECFCHTTVEGTVDCINAFDCSTALTCTSSSTCPSGQACYVDTCCGPGGVCGPSDCQPGGSTPVRARSSGR